MSFEQEPEATFLAGGGEMGALMRAKDWSDSLGPPSQWSQSLRTAVRLILNTRHPMYIFWGPEAYCLYNDSYRATLTDERHPSSLGTPGFGVWEEIWDIIGPQISQIMSGGGATWHENQLVPTIRNGVLTEVYWTYTYSPIDDQGASNDIGGVLVVCNETTANVRDMQRLADIQEHFELALSGGGGIGTWDWDIVKDRVVADARFAKLYGVNPDRAASGAPIAEFFAGMHPDDLPDVQTKIAAAFEGQDFNSEYRLVQPDGSFLWVSARGRCSFDETASQSDFQA